MIISPVCSSFCPAFWCPSGQNQINFIQLHLSNNRQQDKTTESINDGQLKPNTHRRRRRDETVESRRRQRCEQNSQLAHDDCRRIRSTIWKLTRLHSVWLHQFWQILITFSRMTSLCRHCFKIHVVKQHGVYLVSFQNPNCRPNLSVVVVS